MVDFAKRLREGPRSAPPVPRLVVAVTGHRPAKLRSCVVADDGYEWGNPLRAALRARIEHETARLIIRSEVARIAAADADLIERMGDDPRWEEAVEKLKVLMRDSRGECHGVVGQSLEAIPHYAPRAAAGEHHRLRALPGVGEDRMRALHLDSYLRQVEWRRPMHWRTADPVLCLTGCAQGVDQDAAGTWRRMGLPYVAVVPFRGQEARWPAEAQRVYRAVLTHAAGVVYVAGDGPAAGRAPGNTYPETPAGHDAAVAALHARNDWLGCATDELISVWDGSSGGTASCTRGFERLGRRAVRVDPREYLR